MTEVRLDAARGAESKISAEIGVRLRDNGCGAKSLAKEHLVRVLPVPYCSVAIINSAYAVRNIARSVSGMQAGRRFDVEGCSRSS